MRCDLSLGAFDVAQWKEVRNQAGHLWMVGLIVNSTNLEFQLRAE
jgi:hypothetical protein